MPNTKRQSHRNLATLAAVALATVLTLTGFRCPAVEDADVPVVIVAPDGGAETLGCNPPPGRHHCQERRLRGGIWVCAYCGAGCGNAH